MLDRLFVYGTLRRGCDNPWQRRLRREAQWLGHAQVVGGLYDLGPYPAMVRSPFAAGMVIGDLYRLRAPTATLRWLDAYEGCDAAAREPREYRRKYLEIVAVGGTSVDAWVYLYTRPLRGAIPIETGDYLAFCARGSR
ncbi:MAG: gamma-glutamylcyclotransferase [Thiotrichales bacterium]